MERPERIGMWVRERSARTKHVLLAIAVAGPWMLHGWMEATGSLSDVGADLVIVGAVGASVVATACTTTLGLRPWKRSMLTYVISVNLGLAEFAHLYWSISQQSSEAFSISLTRLDAVYLAMTVFSTTGFGDIAPTSQLARALVTLQMGLGFAAVIIGIGVLLSSRPTTSG